LPTTTTWKQKRGKLARLSQSLPADHPQLVALRRDLYADRLAEHIKNIVDQAPPFTQEQVAQLRVLLEPARRELAELGGGDAA
jgi:hypothetical protein